MSGINGFFKNAKTAGVMRLGAGFGLLLMLSLSAAPAYAQTRTWVSGVGDDVNPCSRTAPCKTFAGAISKTAAGGEINCLDSGGFGALTITKSISVVCEGVVGGVLVSGTNGFLINAAATDVVVLRGLDFEGVGTGLNGIKFLSGAVLHVDNCRIRNFTTVGGWGILFTPSAAAELYVTNTIISRSGLTSDGGGILVKAAAGSTSKATINQSNVQNNLFGIKADGTGSAGGVINMTIRDTASAGNTSNGIVGTTPAGGAAIVMIVDRSESSHNAGFGIVADGAATTIRVGASSITGNATGVGATNGAVLRSYKTNEIDGNTSDGTPVTAVGLN